jgi:hypothetical protein
MKSAKERGKTSKSSDSGTIIQEASRVYNEEEMKVKRETN